MRQINLSSTELFSDPANPFVRFDPGDGAADLLWVVASHVNVPEGKFAQNHVFERMPGAKLFLNCAENGWYQNGVGRRLPTLSKLVAAIGQFSEGFGQTHFIGHSMGAYLALILAHEFDRGGQFLATSPEPVLMRKASRSHDNHVLPRFGWRDLMRRYAGHSPRTRGVTIFGAHDPVDAGFLANLPGDQTFYADVYSAPHHHGVTEYLTRHQRYAPLLRDPVGMARTLCESGVIDTAETYGTAAQFARFHTAYIRFRAGEIAAAAGQIAADPDWPNAGWQALAASIHRHRGKTDAAVTAAHRAFRAGPDIPAYVKEYALALIAARARRELAKLHRRLTRRTRRHPAIDQTLRDIERSGVLDRDGGGKRRGDPPAEAPAWLASTTDFEVERARRASQGALVPFARALPAHFPAVDARPDLVHAMIATLVQAGLRRTAASLLESASFPGAKGLSQRVRLMLPNPVERHFDGNFY